MKDQLNYVWISNKDYYDPSRYVCGSPIPAEYINNVYAISDRNRDMQIQIWADYDLLEENGLSFLEKLKKPDNLTLRNLHDIDRYCEMPLFQDTSTSIWHRVDLARLLVLEHVLQCNETSIACYSDFDVLLNECDNWQNEAKHKITKTGFLFGRYCSKDRRFVDNRVENGFVGVHKKGLSDLQEKFISPTIQHFKEYRRDGWLAFKWGADSVCKGICRWPDVAIVASTFTGNHILFNRQRPFAENARLTALGAV